jgi:hypothetical protein
MTAIRVTWAWLVAWADLLRDYACNPTLYRPRRWPTLRELSGGWRQQWYIETGEWR